MKYRFGEVSEVMIPEDCEYRYDNFERKRLHTAKLSSKDDCSKMAVTDGCVGLRLCFDDLLLFGSAACSDSSLDLAISNN